MTDPTYDPQAYGEPDLEYQGFQLWIHGYQFSDFDNEFDANWLRVTAHCGESGASVWASGSILMTTDISRWADQCQALHRMETDKAELSPYEPDLKVTIAKTDQLGHLSFTVLITPDHINQEHRFEFEMDQTFLLPLARQCRAILEKYPVRGNLGSNG